MAHTTTTTDVPRDLLAALAESLGVSVDLAVARYRFPVGTKVRVPLGTGTRRHMVEGTVTDHLDYGPYGRPSGLNLVPAGVDPDAHCIIVRVDLGHGVTRRVRDYGAMLVEVA